MATSRPRKQPAFTLIELLVVITIIGLISAVALPVVLPALNERRVSEAARLFQAVLVGARDAAIRANAPRGIRLLPDPILNPTLPNTPSGVLASNRFVAIEPAGDYTTGLITAGHNPSGPNAGTEFLRIDQSYLTSGALPAEPTGWFFNIRQGDKIRFNDSGSYYTIAGPMYTGPGVNVNSTATFQNSERFINMTPAPGFPVYPGPLFAPPWTPNVYPKDFLFLVNGQDDDGDGWVDEGFDGIDNDGDGIVDPGFNGLDDDGDGYIDNPDELKWHKVLGPGKGNEWEIETFVGSQSTAAFSNLAYTIVRRPVVSSTSGETALPEGVVIDLTTWNAPSATPPESLIDPATGAYNGKPIQFPERSRVPVDPYTYFVDIMIAPSGQVVQAGAGSAGIDGGGSSPTSNLPFYHFWLTDRVGVVGTQWGQKSLVPYVPLLNPNYTATPSQTFLLPMPQGTANYAPLSGQATPYLKGERRLVTLFTRTGQIVTNSIEIFDGNDINRPFYDAQAGIKEQQ